MKNIVLHSLAAVGSFGMAVGLMNGIVQKYISFADPLNEMGMCVIMLMMGSAFTCVVASDIREKLK